MTQGTGAAPTNGPTMIRSEERVSVHTQPVVYDRVRVHRRIITEERIVRVQVRREELVLESDTRAVGRQPDAGTMAGPSEPLVFVLRREVPEVVLRTEAYERVTVAKHRVAGEQKVSAEVGHEVIELERGTNATR